MHSFFKAIVKERTVPSTNYHVPSISDNTYICPIVASHRFYHVPIGAQQWKLFFFLCRCLNVSNHCFSTFRHIAIRDNNTSHCPLPAAYRYLYMYAFIRTQKVSNSLVGFFLSFFLFLSQHTVVIHNNEDFPTSLSTLSIHVFTNRIEIRNLTLNIRK